MSRLELVSPPRHAENPASNQLAYNYREVSSAFDNRPQWLHDNVRSSLSATLRRVTDLPRHQQDSDRKAGSALNIRSFLQSIRWTHRMYEDVRLLGARWIEPLVSVDEFGDVVFEWWHGKRKITVYITPELVEYVKVRGPDMQADMDDGDLRTQEDRQDLWRWLTSTD